MAGLLSAVIICQDEEHRIRGCLESLAFCDELIVVDSGSTDATVAIAQSFGARIFERPFVGQNDQKDFGRRQANGAWVLVLDADERVSPELRDSILETIEDDDPRAAAYAFRFETYFRGQRLRHGGYSSQFHLRLFRPHACHYDLSVPVHDRLIVRGGTRRLRGVVEHHSYESIDDFLEKSARYARGFAEHAFQRGRRTTAWAIAFRSLWRFVRNYAFRLGFLDGALGLTMCALQGHEVFQKYARLYELQRFGVSGEPAATAEIEPTSTRSHVATS